MSEVFNDQHILSHYFIDSSHNTYLIDNQIIGNASYCGYIAHLNLIKGGCLEIDPVEINKEKNDVYVSHAYVSGLVGRIKLSIVLKLIKEWIEKNYNEMKGPLILSFDNKTIKTKEDHNIVWKVLNNEIYGESNNNQKWYYSLNKHANVPLKDLKGKILIKWDQCDQYDFKTGCSRKLDYDKSKTLNCGQSKTGYERGKGLIPPPDTYETKQDNKK